MKEVFLEIAIGISSRVNVLAHLLFHLSTVRGVFYHHIVLGYLAVELTINVGWKSCFIFFILICC